MFMRTNFILTFILIDLLASVLMFVLRPVSDVKWFKLHQKSNMIRFYLIIFRKKYFGIVKSFI